MTILLNALMWLLTVTESFRFWVSGFALLKCVFLFKFFWSGEVKQKNVMEGRNRRVLKDIGNLVPERVAQGGKVEY